jgi:hypothetical protein
MSSKLFALTMGAFIVGALSGNVRADEPAVIQACGQGGCSRDHGCPHDGVCVPYTKTRQVEKRCYTDTCEQFCLPKCSLLGGLFGGCGSCGGCGDGSCGAGSCGADHECGHVRTKKYLIVKIKHEEECVPACKVESCAAPCSAPAPVIQPVPAKQMPAPKTASALPVQVLEYRDLPLPKK